MGEEDVYVWTEYSPKLWIRVPRNCFYCQLHSIVSTLLIFDKIVTVPWHEDKLVALFPSPCTNLFIEVVIIPQLDTVASRVGWIVCWVVCDASFRVRGYVDCQQLAVIRKF